MSPSRSTARDAAPSLFGAGPVIARLTPDKSSPLWVHVIVNGRRVAKLPASRAAELGAHEGAPWTDGLSRAAALATESLKAKLRAVKLLKVRDRASGELAARLKRAGFSPAAIDQAIRELTAQSLLDDQALAQTKARAAAAKGLSAAATEDRLNKAGLSPGAAAHALAAVAAGGDLARATEQARNRAAKLPESLDAPARYRRVLSALARLGYDQDIAQEAAAAAVPHGATPDA